MTGWMVIGAGVVLVFALYRIMGMAMRRSERARYQRAGRMIDWQTALGRVGSGDGYFVIECNGKDPELFYAEGEMPMNETLLRQIFAESALMVLRYPGPASLANLKRHGVDRSVELNTAGLVVLSHGTSGA